MASLQLKYRVKDEEFQQEIKKLQKCHSDKVVFIRDNQSENNSNGVVISRKAGNNVRRMESLSGFHTAVELESVLVHYSKDYRKIDDISPKVADADFVRSDKARQAEEMLEKIIADNEIEHGEGDDELDLDELFEKANLDDPPDF
jgi:hypothetical protein